ncbi:zinc-binding dehydrogenase [Streptomyces sp. NBS 14/10]|uniref:zinc-binding dehydrogenase n=1 Tax=Streptomyces sp. NBS 14/10 TaxID=1945643 RepID=UPI0015C6275A|nr:zinc-binding dehydrogenase [Streptomyces sp. NBS 14/10]KAK1184523.1 zinc-binding dehydrogenase [Streptomyces sp. NBS 14/10]
MQKTMHAIRLTGPVTPYQLTVTDVPVPDVRPGWVRIRVKAFGVNESEVTSRKGQSSPDFSFPRILGIEGIGIVDAVPENSDLRPGQKVATMMGGMGRAFDGSYAEYTLVPAGQLIPFDTDLPWETVGALPEMFQTAHGSLTTGLGLKAGQTLLIRGGTSTVGLSAATLAKGLGTTVLSTTRRPQRAQLLRDHGVDHPIVDDGKIAERVQDLFPDGVDAALELVGGPALPDTLRAVRPGGTACFTGSLADQWTIPDFNPFAVIPIGVRLTVYGGEATDLPPTVFDHQLRAIGEGRLKPAIAKVYHGLDQVPQAHIDLEASDTPGKHVVVLD